MFYVYILLSLKDKRTYVGYTNDLKKRLSRHNNAKVFSTKYRLPLKLIYYEVFLSKEDAKEKEKFYKTGWGRNHIKKFLANTIKIQKFGRTHPL